MKVVFLLVVSRKDIIPLFHETYMGNNADSKIFAETMIPKEGSIEVAADLGAT